MWPDNQMYKPLTTYYSLREAEKKDLDQILSCLSTLSPVDGDRTNIIRAFNERDNSGNVYTFVAEQLSCHAHPTDAISVVFNTTIVGTASVFIHRKLSRGGGAVSYIEDVAVHKDHQSKGIGRDLVTRAIEMSRNVPGCYKIVLNCSDNLIPFYEKLGFVREGNEMTLRFAP